MKYIQRRLWGIVCLILSVYTPFWIYAIMHNVDTTSSHPSYWPTALATLVSFAIFCAFRLIKKTKNRAWYLGAIGSYIAFYALFLTYLANTNNASSCWAILSIVILGAYLTPVVLLCGTGSMLIIEPKWPEQGVADYRRQSPPQSERWRWE